MAEVRKAVTVVFSDITGSTELGERLEPEAVRGLLGRYFEVMRGVLEAHGGTVGKYIGDAVMAVFGVPRLHEDDALRAVRAAVEMRSALVALNEELARDLGVRLETRTGLNSGEVVAGVPAEDWLVVGDAVNVAARLQQAAAPGEILIGEETRRLAAAALELAPVEPLTLKGKREPVLAWRVLGVIDGASAFVRRLDAPMIGRSEELRLLRDAVESAFASRVPHTLTVLGPAGIGKSRLVNELVAGVGEGTGILLGRCLPYGEGITYWPLAEIARQAGLPGEAFGLAAGSSSQQTFWVARTQLEELARERPLLVVFDDIHWGEPTFLDLLEYVRGFAAEVPLVLVCQARPELLELRPSWAVAASNSKIVQLLPLSESESRQLASDGIEEDVVERIVTRAEGNPLYVEQMVAMLREGGDLEAIPPTIRALLAARVDRLEPEERDTIERASIEGAIFHRAAVEELLHESARPQLGARLMALIRTGLIRPDRSAFAADDAFRFSHLLIRDAVYAAIPKHARAEYHEGHARWLRVAVGPRLLEYEEILGYHYEQASLYRLQLGALDEHAHELGTQAASLLEGAGRRAYARSDIAAAINLLGRAAALPTSNRAERLECLLMLSVALDYGGQAHRAGEVAAEALAEANSLGDRRLLALAHAQAGAVALHTDPAATAAEYALVLEQAIATCEESGDQYGLAVSRRRLGWAWQIEGRYDASIDQFERAAMHASRAGHAREETLALAMLTESLAFGTTRVDEAVKRCLAIVEQPASELAAQRAAARSSLAVLYAMQGDAERARANAAHSWQALEPFGEKHAVAQGASSVGYVELVGGDLTAAEAALRRGYDALAGMGDSGFLAPIAALLAEAMRRQGKGEEAQALTDEAENLAAPDDFVTQSAWRSTRAQILSARGEHEQAERLARAAVELVETTDAILQHGEALLAFAVVLRAAGREVEAATAANRALGLYEQKGDAVDAARARALQHELVSLAP